MKLEFSKFLEFYGEHQDKDNKFFYEHYPKADKNIIRSYKSRAKKKIVSKNVSPKVSKKKISIPPQDTTREAPTYIDDPDELLLSVAVRELNRPNPDPRWANVLITTRKENIGISKKEGNIRSKFKSMNIKDIATILSTKQKDTSQKPGLKESS